MNQPIINVDDIKLEHAEAGDQFEVDMGHLSPLLGAKKLGYRLCVIPPGKRAWPYHAHLVNEEMVYVISGNGTLRHADDEFQIKTGDIVNFAADRDKPHQIINSSAAPLKYLCISTMEAPDIVIYPDSGKYGVLAGSAPGGDKTDRTFEIFAKSDGGVPYWQDEF